MTGLPEIMAQGFNTTFVTVYRRYTANSNNFTTSFNTTFVTVYPVPVQRFLQVFCVSIQPLLLFILINTS